MELMKFVGRVAPLLFVVTACVSNEPVGQPTPLDGEWLGSYHSRNVDGPVGQECSDGYGGLVIMNGVVSGEASNPYGASYQVSGRVFDDLFLQAEFIYQQQPQGHLTGRLVGDRLEGSFDGINNCEGNWVAIRK
ncbi:hypothetical protein [Celeribacter litoreus]|uniref:hypothetical protein n=1 Tax=Celeribacter litoreus TaxID=2876714 RepID=UPI001CC9A6F1|nr:hypothetical protein [Celeribacter litoreus]MCA0042876.1 hypothetical protein [Celeribacter litoreus]